MEMLKQILFSCLVMCFAILGGFALERGLEQFSNEEVVSVPKYTNTLQQNTNPPLRIYPLAWEKNDSSRREWSRILYVEIEKNFDSLDARDMENFCPNYSTLPRQQKINVWGQLFALMSYYESAWIPTARLAEPLLGIDPVTKLINVSEGLLQLGYSDNLYHGCKFDWENDSKLDATDPNKSIFNPQKNLSCGVKIMAEQIQKYHAIVIGKGAYWAVIKQGHPNSKVFLIADKMKIFEPCKYE